MSTLLELFNFFERTHQSTLAKYRGTPWHLGASEKGNLEIVDRITKRHLANIDSAGERFTVTTTHLRNSTILALSTVDEQGNSNPIGFTSAHEAAQFVWRKEASWFQLGSWYMVSWTVLLADWLVALGKISLRILVVSVAISALWSILFGIDKASDGLMSDIVGFFLSMFESAADTQNPPQQSLND